MFSPASRACVEQKLPNDRAAQDVLRKCAKSIAGTRLLGNFVTECLLNDLDPRTDSESGSTLRGVGLAAHCDAGLTGWPTSGGFNRLHGAECLYSFPCAGEPATGPYPQINSVYIFTPDFCIYIHFNIISYRLLGLPSFLCLSALSTNTFHNLLIFTLIKLADIQSALGDHPLLAVRDKVRTCLQDCQWPCD
jgi:hypothetical protein